MDFRFATTLKLALVTSLLCLLVVLLANRALALPLGVEVSSDIAYGDHERQVLDVYYPSNKHANAPIIVMVHGGAWRLGDKAADAVVKNKVAHWVSKGFIFISVNYRLLPNTQPLEQAEDVQKALLFAQQHAHLWGGAANKIILMGHSAGAHLVSLVAVNYNTAIKPWLGTIALDSTAYDIDLIMRSSPRRFYKTAFGEDPTYWKLASPFHVLHQKITPFLAICSTKRDDGACIQAEHFIEKATRYGANAQLIPINRSHRNSNAELGKDNDYTQQVDDFIKTLHPDFAHMLVNS